MRTTFDVSFQILMFLHTVARILQPRCSFDRTIAAPKKCVLVSTCPLVRVDLKNWDISADGEHWKGQLDVRDLNRFGSIAADGALPVVFKEMLQIPCTNSDPAALHGSEVSLVSISRSALLPAFLVVHLAILRCTGEISHYSNIFFVFLQA